MSFMPQQSAFALNALDLATPVDQPPVASLSIAYTHAPAARAAAVPMAFSVKTAIKLEALPLDDDRSASAIVQQAQAESGASVAQKLIGTAEADTLIGTEENDIIKGRKGADVIQGKDGDDLINGGRGRDVISGDDGNDIIKGGRGADNLHGGAGKDLLDGGRGADKLLLESGDLAIGGLGRDTFEIKGTGFFRIQDYDPQNDGPLVILDPASDYTVYHLEKDRLVIEMGPTLIILDGHFDPSDINIQIGRSKDVKNLADIAQNAENLGDTFVFDKTPAHNNPATPDALTEEEQALIVAEARAQSDFGHSAATDTFVFTDTASQEPADQNPHQPDPYAFHI